MDGFVSTGVSQYTVRCPTPKALRDQFLDGVVIQALPELALDGVLTDDSLDDGLRQQQGLPRIIWLKINEYQGINVRIYIRKQL